MSYIKSFFLSLLIYFALLFCFILAMFQKNENISYTDNQSIVRLIQGDLQSDGVLNTNKELVKNEKIEAKDNILKNEVSVNNLNDKIDSFIENETTASAFDPFDNISVVEKKYQKSAKVKVDSSKIDAINKAVEYADKSISSSSGLTENKSNSSLKKGNAKENAMPGKYDKYKGMINRKLNEIWQLYRSDSENFIRLTIKINLFGRVEIINYERVSDTMFMSNVNKFLDKIQKEEFGVPPDGEFVIDLLLQTNRREQGVSVY